MHAGRGSTCGKRRWMQMPSSAGRRCARSPRSGVTPRHSSRPKFPRSSPPCRRYSQCSFSSPRSTSPSLPKLLPEQSPFSSPLPPCFALSLSLSLSRSLSLSLSLAVSPHTLAPALRAALPPYVSPGARPLGPRAACLRAACLPVCMAQAACLEKAADSMLGACAAWQRLDGLLREAEELDGEFEDVAQTSALVELELEALRYVVCSVASCVL